MSEYEPREYSALATDRGIVLCDKMDGVFLVLKGEEDLIKLKQLLEGIDRIKVMRDGQLKINGK